MLEVAEWQEEAVEEETEFAVERPNHQVPELLRAGCLGVVELVPRLQVQQEMWMTVNSQAMILQK